MQVKAIAFINRKGGTGKTTISFNTAVEIARRGVKVSFVECDFSTRSATYLWDSRFISMEEDYYTLKDYLMGECKPEDIVYVSRRFRELENVYFIPGGFVREEERKILRKHEENLKKLDRLIEFLYDKSELIIIDTPASGNLYSLVDYLMFLPVADGVIPVIEPTKPALDGVKPLLKLSSLMGIKCPALVFNKLRVLSVFKGSRTLQALKGELDLLVEDAKPFTVPFDRAVVESWKRGVPVVLHKPKCKASRAIRRIAAELFRWETGGVVVGPIFGSGKKPGEAEVKLEEIERLLLNE